VNANGNVGIPKAPRGLQPVVTLSKYGPLIVAANINDEWVVYPILRYVGHEILHLFFSITKIIAL